MKCVGAGSEDVTTSIPKFSPPNLITAGTNLEVWSLQFEPSLPYRQKQTNTRTIMAVFKDTHGQEATICSKAGGSSLYWCMKHGSV